MWMMMIISYLTVALIDTAGMRKKVGARVLFIYGLLMTISYIIGNLNGTEYQLPSPAEPIKNIVLSIIGK